MGGTLFEALSELRDVCRGVPGLYVEYPFPRTIELFPMLIITANEGELAGTDEQLWEEDVRGLLLNGLVDNPMSMAAADQLIEPIADLFKPSVGPDRNRNYQLNGKVDFCRVQRYELGAVVELGEKKYYGGNIWFKMKRRRFAV